MSTIRDVAEASGVSISTVSHVINNTRYVSPETRERVLQAIESLNYKHNRVASSLRNQKTHTLGVVLPNNTNPFFAEVLSGIETACMNAGYNIFMGNAHDDPHREHTYLDGVLARQVDGVLLISTGAAETSVVATLKRTVPVVVVDRSINAPNVDELFTDNAQGGRIATEYLLALGHRRIACITGPSFLNPSAMRVKAYVEAMNAAGLAPQLFTGDFQYESGYQAVKALIEAPQPPTAIFACNDLMALGALCALHEAGLTTPHDISVIGYDDIPSAAYSVPRLTTMSQPAEALGQLAVQRLIERLESPELPARRDVLPVKLITRASCSHPPEETTP